MAVKKVLIERALVAELSHHLGFSVCAVLPREGTNLSPGSTGKIVAKYACGMTVRQIQAFLAD